MENNKELSIRAEQLTKSPQAIFNLLSELQSIKMAKTVVYTDGSYRHCADGVTFEYEQDDNYLVTI